MAGMWSLAQKGYPRTVTWNKLKDAKITAGSNSPVTCVYVTNESVEARTGMEKANAALEKKKR